VPASLRNDPESSRRHGGGIRAGGYVRQRQAGRGNPLDIDAALPVNQGGAARDANADRCGPQRQADVAVSATRVP